MSNAPNNRESTTMVKFNNSAIVQNTKFHIPKSNPSGFEEQLNSEQQQSAQF
jgi:hypothetical protein